MKGKLLHR
jgi:tetratricopeptide (TPR) repeat protein